MPKNTKSSSPILNAVHEIAQDLHDAGFIDKRKMRQFDVLCLAPIPHYDADKIRTLRNRHRLSQAALAILLNTSLSAVRQWELGSKSPGGSSQKLLHLLESKGIEALL